MSDQAGAYWRLPEEDVQFAIQFETDTTHRKLLMGDRINLRAGQNNLPVVAVAGSFAEAAGASGESYRDFAWVAAAVPPDMREEFPLSYSQWRACIPAGARPIAEWAVGAGVSPSGRPASVVAIRAHVAQMLGEYVQVQHFHVRRLGRILERLAGDGRIDPGLARLAGRLLAVLRRRWNYGAGG